MAKMGDKLESKAIARMAKVSCIPGHVGVISGVEEAKEVAKRIGYPVMLKASAGGGGKGMRIACGQEEIADAFRLAKAEAKSSFGDDRILIERFIEEPRHVEFQLIGDQHGNVVYLPERECSIQRRNQKVLEEAPSPFLDSELRETMGSQATQLAKAVKYHSAGTVEFLMDKKKNFYFLEMNTRLQVEHPITELVSGIDLVEQMIRVARGEQLQFKQSDVKIDGWAVESRVYAEDPKLFLPSIGRLTRYVEPSGKGVRCDSGIREGSDISVYYDPMICKLCTHDKTRSRALEKMASALDAFVVRGVTHNIPLLREIVSSEEYKSGVFSTNYLSQYYPNGFDGHKLSVKEANILASIAVHLRIVDDCEKMFSMEREVDPRVYNVAISGFEDGKFLKPKISQEIIRSNYDRNSPVIEVHIGDKRYTVQRLPETPDRIVWSGTEYTVQVLTDTQLAHSTKLPKATTHFTNQQSQVLSPMPGLVVSVAVKPGDTVREGDEIAVIEAMKMQNVLRAKSAGVVDKVHVASGHSVGNRQLLVEFKDVQN
jgi:propionyl-CoA carboxylase alpha chain